MNSNVLSSRYRLNLKGRKSGKLDWQTGFGLANLGRLIDDATLFLNPSFFSWLSLYQLGRCK